MSEYDRLSAQRDAILARQRAAQDTDVIERCAAIADAVAQRFDSDLAAATRTGSHAGAGHSIGSRSAAREIAAAIRALVPARRTAYRNTREAAHRGEQDTARLDALEAEHTRVDPVMALTVKRFYRRDGSEWANVASNVRDAIDAALASASPEPTTEPTDA